MRCLTSTIVHHNITREMDKPDFELKGKRNRPVSVNSASGLKTEMSEVREVGIRVNELSKVNSIWERWETLASSHENREAVVHWVAGEEPIRWTYGDLVSAAKSIASKLKKCGVKRGQVCAIIIRHNPFFYPVYMGIAACGALPAVLAYPNPRLHPDKFRQGLEGMSKRSGLDWILTERELVGMINPLVQTAKSTIRGFYFPLEWPEVEAPSNKDIQLEASFVRSDPFLLQHSSGTTGLQKPVLLSNGAVLEHIVNYAKAIDLTLSDKIVSWLPLYHDMGLIAAFHLPLAFGIPTIQIDPFEWVLAPQLLLEAITQEKATLTWLPNFAYNMLADKLSEDKLEGIRLDSLRLLINCSEPIRHSSHQKFVDRYVSYGLNPLALSSCYAMAETTFAVTQNPPNREIPHLVVNREKLASGHVVEAKPYESSRICVSSGILIDGCQIRIVDKNRIDVTHGVVGEIAIQSISMFDGYRNYPQKTAEVFDNGWFYSGDLGFCHEGNYYIIGRQKDIIIVAGKNIYPEDIEDMIGSLIGIIPGRVVAFGEDDETLGTEVISVVAETNAKDDREKQLITNQIKLACISIDVNIANVYLVPPRWLIKSSAGKPSRKANLDRILAEKLQK